MLKKAGLTGLSAAAIVGFLVLMAVGLLIKEPVTGSSGFTRVQKPAPEFVLPLFAGGKFDLAQRLGEPVIVNFWASWCPPCREEASALERTWRAYRDRGVTLVGVDIQDTEADARAYIAEFDITYPNGPDEHGRITVDYGVVGIPVTFFISREGIVMRRFVGALSERDLVEWTEELLSGGDVGRGAEGESPDGPVRLDQ